MKIFIAPAAATLLHLQRELFAYERAGMFDVLLEIADVHKVCGVAV